MPLTFNEDLLEWCRELTGISFDSSVQYQKTSFSEGLLFTHRGLSGPSILQISSYWKDGDEIIVNLAPDTDIMAFLKDREQSQPKQEVHNALSDILPKRLAQNICQAVQCNGRLADLPDKKLQAVATAINDWHIKPNGTEGYRTAEVTLGGVDTAALNSKTMECKGVEGLYFIGEVVDVTGHLGGFNFQWAWASGYAAGQTT